MNVPERDDSRQPAPEKVEMFPSGTERVFAPRIEITDHAQATVELLEDVVRHLRYGDPPESWGRLVGQIGRMMSRRT